MPEINKASAQMKCGTCGKKYLGTGDRRFFAMCPCDPEAPVVIHTDGTETIPTGHRWTKAERARFDRG